MLCTIDKVVVSYQEQCPAEATVELGIGCRHEHADTHPVCTSHRWYVLTAPWSWVCEACGNGEQPHRCDVLIEVLRLISA